MEPEPELVAVLGPQFRAVRPRELAAEAEVALESTPELAQESARILGGLKPLWERRVLQEAPLLFAAQSVG